MFQLLDAESNFANAIEIECGGKQTVSHILTDITGLVGPVI